MLIGLSGYAGSGKNTAADILRIIRPTHVNFEERSFARALKVSFARMFLTAGDQMSAEHDYEGWTDDEMVAFCDHFKAHGRMLVPTFKGGMMPDGHSVDSWSIEEISGRQALQRYGTECHRDVFGSDFWVDQVLPRTTNNRRPHLRDDHLVVITDCRFPNEAMRVLQEGGEVWRIERESVKPINGHASEIPLDDLLVSRGIDNNGTLEALTQNLREALKHSLKVAV